MINITLALANPFSKTEFRMIKSKSFKTPFKNKFIELQLSRDMSIIGMSLVFLPRHDPLFVTLCLGGALFYLLAIGITFL